MDDTVSSLPTARLFTVAPISTESSESEPDGFSETAPVKFDKVTPVLPIAHGVPELLTLSDQLPTPVYAPARLNVYAFAPEPTVA